MCAKSLVSFKVGKRLFAAAAAEKTVQAAAITTVADKKKGNRQAIATVEDSVKATVLCEQDYQ